MARLVAILGSVTPPGRSLKALEWALRCAAEVQPGIETQLLNLHDYRISFADGRAPDQFGDDTGAVVEKISSANALLLASPVYRGSISGVLKNLLDHLPVEALASKPCGIIAVGATEHHFLGVDWHLRDVLAWFGALTMPTSVYLSSADFVGGEPSPIARQNLRQLVVSVLKMAAAIAKVADDLGPPPLAASRA
jgi:FMN reductase